MKKILCVIITILTIFFVNSTNLLAQKKNQPKKRPSKVKKVSSPTIDQQADQQAIEFWNSKLTKCGNDFYTQAYVSFTSERQNIIFQFKNLSFTKEKRVVSNADKLNGLEYRGVSRLNVEASRQYSSVKFALMNAGWNRWQDGLPIRLQAEGLTGEQDFTIFLSKEEGGWNVDSFNSSLALLLRPIDCASVPES